MFSYDPRLVHMYDGGMIRAAKASSRWTVNTRPSYDIGFRNSGRIKSYLDGLELITEKHQLPTHVPFALRSLDLLGDEPGMFFLKPSHPYIGSGKMISYGTAEEISRIRRPKTFMVGKSLHEIRHWVIQADEGSSPRFDYRHYTAIFYKPGSMMVLHSKSCIKRVAPPGSPITNLSESLKLGHTGLMEVVVVEGIRDVAARCLECIEMKPVVGESGFVLLGFDILPDLRIIEVNSSPTLLYGTESLPEVFGSLLWNDLLDIAFPMFFKGEKGELSHWD